MAEINPEDYPPITEVGRGRFRLSWWEPGVLAGIEIWPDDDEDANSLARYFSAVIERKKL